jgi:hypothetical protein
MLDSAQVTSIDIRNVPEDAGRIEEELGPYSRLVPVETRESGRCGD